MSNVCQGKTLKGLPCSKRIKGSAIFCHNHRDQQFKEVEKKKEIKVIPVVKTVEEKIEEKIVEKKILSDDCAICMCEVEVNDDCELRCKHPFHLECIKQLHEPKCPVCRGTLEGSKLDDRTLNKITTKQQEDQKERDDDVNRRVEEIQRRQRALLNMMMHHHNHDESEDGEDSEEEINRQIAIIDRLHNRRQQQNNHHNHNQQQNNFNQDDEIAREVALIDMMTNMRERNGNNPPNLGNFINAMRNNQPGPPNPHRRMVAVIQDQNGNIVGEFNL
jgi:hypothetical protein